MELGLRPGMSTNKFTEAAPIMSKVFLFVPPDHLIISYIASALGKGLPPRKDASFGVGLLSPKPLNP